MNSNGLTPSEVIVLCGERFADQIRSQDSSTERTLSGQKSVNAERLAVAAIRGAILANQSLGITKVSWRTADELKQELQQLSGGVGGLGGAMPGALSRTSVLDKPNPHLELGTARSAWSTGTLEALMADFENQASVFEQIEHKVAPRPSGAGVILNVKQALLQRGLLETFARGYGVLAPGFKLTDSARQQLEVQLPQVQALLNAAKREDLEMWNGLEVAITRVLRSGL